MNQIEAIALAPFRLGAAQSSHLKSLVGASFGMNELIHFALLNAVMYFTLAKHDIRAALMYSLSAFGAMMVAGAFFGVPPPSNTQRAVSAVQGVASRAARGAWGGVSNWWNRPAPDVKPTAAQIGSNKM